MKPKIVDYVKENHARWLRLLPMFMIYVLLFGGFNFFFPFHLLQARSLGLSQQDVTQVLAVVSLLSFPANPVSGYIGDKIGYNAVFIASCLIFVSTAIGHNFLPPYQKYEVTQLGFETESEDFIPGYENLVWFGEYLGNSSLCNSSDPLWVSVANIECSEQSFEVNFNLSGIQSKLGTSGTCENLNHDFCTWTLNESSKAMEFCHSVEGSDITQGSFDLTYWLFFGVRIVYVYTLNGLFNTADAMASTLARRENSSFALLSLGGYIMSIITPLLSGPLIDNFPISLGKTGDCLIPDIERETYLVGYVAMAVFIVSATFVSLFVSANVEKKDKTKLSFKEEFGWLWNPAAIGFYAIQLVNGILFGVEDAAYYVYLHDIGVNNIMIGQLSSLNNAIGFCELLMVPFIQKKFGSMTLVLLPMFMYSLKTIMISFTWNDPPYELFAYQILGMMAIQWPGVVGYIGLIAPKNLVATAIGFAATATWIIGKGCGSLLSGALDAQVGTKWMFRIVGGSMTIVTVIYTILYLFWLKKYERSCEEDMDEEQKGEEESQSQHEPKPNLRPLIMEEYSSMRSIMLTRL